MHLAEVVADLFDGLRSQAEAKGVMLHADVPAGLPPVDADPQRLRQILLNLLSNALHHTPAGGGSGIGLTISKHLVEAHGGRIWAESAGPGQGSTFAFTLSLAS